MAVSNSGLTGFELFWAVFHQNLAKRSRTAKGKTDTAVSDKKKKLSKDGVELGEQVRINTGLLIQSVWDSVRTENIDPIEIRWLMEEWNAIINKNLQGPDIYLEEIKKLEQEASELAQKTGKLYRINKAYRVWDVPYGLKIPPVELELAMDEFYQELAARIKLALDCRLPQAELLAYADRMSDSGIHAWADGCGRISTALVMWLSILVPGFTMPLFGTRDEHYQTIQDLAEHTKYYQKCLNKRIF